MSTVVSFSRVRLSHGMQKWSAKLSNPGVIFEHVSKTSVRYLDDRGRHGTEMTVFLANFDSQTCTSGFAIIFWDSVPVMPTCALISLLLPGTDSITRQSNQELLGNFHGPC